MPVLCRQVVLFLCCLLNETFFVMGYLYFYATQGDRPAAKVLKKKKCGGTVRASVRVRVRGGGERARARARAALCLGPPL